MKFIMLIGGLFILEILALVFIPLEYKLYIMLGLFPVVIVIFALIATALLIYQKFNSEAGKDDDGKKLPIIFQVPKNTKYVFRNVWQSDPSDPDKDFSLFGIPHKGYVVKNEGWNFYIPTIWLKFECAVDLAPSQLDPPPYKINCSDGNDVAIDTRVSYFPKHNDSDVVFYTVNVKDKAESDDLIRQRVKVAINRAMDVDSDKAIGWGTDKKKDFGDGVTTIINELLANDGDKNYGIQAVVNIENITPTEEVQAATDRKKAAQIEKEASMDEAEAIKNMIDETGANPTASLIANIIADAFRGTKKAHRKDKSNE